CRCCGKWFDHFGAGSRRRGNPMKLLTIALLLSAFAQDKPKSGIAVYDLGASATEPLALGETPAAFKGDALVSNGRISLAVPRNGSSAALPTGGVGRAKLSLIG